MQTRPETPCEVEKFNRALSQMRLMVERSGLYSRFGVDKRDIPEVFESAMRQHALFYAIESCQSRGGNMGAIQYYTPVNAPSTISVKLNGGLGRPYDYGAEASEIYCRKSQNPKGCRLCFRAGGYFCK